MGAGGKVNAIIKTGNKAVYPIIFPSDYSGLGSINCYVYQNGEDYTLIDAGIKNEEFEQFFYQKLKDYNIEINQITRIILTHFHNDHIGVVNQITNVYPTPVYASHIAIPRLKCEDDYLQQKLTFYYALYEQYGVPEFAHERMAKMENTLHNKEHVMIYPQVIKLGDGQEIGGLQVIAAPGHSPDSICLFDEEAGWLFAGDFLVANGMTSALIDHDHSGNITNPFSQYIDSIEKMNAYNVLTVFAGHKEIYENLNEVMEKSLSKIEYKLQKVISKISEGHHTAKQLGEAIYGDRFAKYFTFIISEIIGLTLLGEQRGLIVRELRNGEWYFTIKSLIEHK